MVFHPRTIWKASRTERNVRMDDETWWEASAAVHLAQGELVANCVVPIMPADLETPDEPSEILDLKFDADLFDVVVVTQSCDLVDPSVTVVASCPYYSQADFEKINPKMAKDGRWGKALNGQMPGLHMLMATVAGGSPLVVDFRTVFSHPKDYLQRQASRSAQRFKLRSPYVEHLSHAFGGYFSRVALPVPIPKIAPVAPSVG